MQIGRLLGIATAAMALMAACGGSDSAKSGASGSSGTSYCDLAKAYVKDVEALKNKATANPESPDDLSSFISALVEYVPATASAVDDMAKAAPAEIAADIKTVNDALAPIRDAGDVLKKMVDDIKAAGTDEAKLQQVASDNPEFQELADTMDRLGEDPAIKAASDKVQVFTKESCGVDLRLDS